MLIIIMGSCIQRLCKIPFSHLIFALKFNNEPNSRITKSAICFIHKGYVRVKGGVLCSSEKD